MRGERHSIEMQRFFILVLQLAFEKFWLSNKKMSLPIVSNAKQRKKCTVKCRNDLEILKKERKKKHLAHLKK